MNEIKTIGHGELLTVWDSKNMQMPMVANCPCSNLNKAFQIFNDQDRYIFELHNTPYNMKPVAA